MRDEFSRFHPTVSFLYFAAVIVFSTVYLNPILLVVSLTAALIYSVYLDGRRSLKFSLMLILPIGLFAAIVNIAFNHNGLTVLRYLPTGNPLTLESVIYGICAAALLMNVIMWFFCFNRVITSDKFIYLFGRIIPSLSLVLSMVLRFIPRFKRQHGMVVTAQSSLQKAMQKNTKKAKGKTKGKNGLVSKIRHSANVFSIMLTWSLENSITTADSMNSRGYGLKGRTAFSNYRFYPRDGVMLCILIILIALQICLTFFGCARVTYYPYYELNISTISVSGYANYGLICILPMIINLTEDIKWNYFRSKI